MNQILLFIYRPLLFILLRTFSFLRREEENTLEKMTSSQTNCFRLLETRIVEAYSRVQRFAAESSLVMAGFHRRGACFESRPVISPNSIVYWLVILRLRRFPVRSYVCHRQEIAGAMTQHLSLPHTSFLCLYEFKNTSSCFLFD